MIIVDERPLEPEEQPTVELEGVYIIEIPFNAEIPAFLSREEKYEYLQKYIKEIVDGGMPCKFNIIDIDI